MAYRLQFPFQLQSSIDGIDVPVFFQIGRLLARLFSRSRYVVLELSGFNTSEEASAHIPIVWAALRWLLIDRGINATFEIQPNNIVNDIAASDGSPLVFREDQNIRFLSGSGTGKTITPLPRFLPPLTDALSRPGTDKLIENSRFRLATDLYSAYYLKNSPSSRLITLGMTLEVLADPTNKHPVALEVIDRWKADIDQCKLAVANDQEAVASLESLDRELLVRKQVSIRSRIRSTANRLASHLSADEQQNLTENAVSTYDARSSLVHKGRLENNNIHELVEKGQRTVSLLLRAYYHDIMGSVS
jgi:hypothetical protein